MSKSIDELLVLLEQAQEQQDNKKIAEYYFELGKAYRKEGRTAKALYYLNRFDNLVSGEDDLYDQFQKKDNQAMDWIEALQAEQMPYELMIQQQVVEKAKDLTDLQKMRWLLLTMSRFCVLFEELSLIPGYDFYGFEKLREIIDYFSAIVYEEPELFEGAEEEIREFYDTIDDVFDSPVMHNYSLKLCLPNQESFVPADLESGDVGTFYFSKAYEELEAYNLTCYSFETEEEDMRETMKFAACGILADYYYRTSETDIKDEPKVQEETARIFSDYAFVKENPDKESFLKRIRDYKYIMLI